MKERLTWGEIVEKYPDKWVALTDCEMEGSRVVSGIVEIVCTESGRYEAELSLLQRGIDFWWRRTSLLNGANILCRL